MCLLQGRRGKGNNVHQIAPGLVAPVTCQVWLVWRTALAVHQQMTQRPGSLSTHHLRQSYQQLVCVAVCLCLYDAAYAYCDAAEHVPVRHRQGCEREWARCVRSWSCCAGLDFANGMRGGPVILPEATNYVVSCRHLQQAKHRQGQTCERSAGSGVCCGATSSGSVARQPETIR